MENRAVLRCEKCRMHRSEEKNVFGSRRNGATPEVPESEAEKPRADTGVKTKSRQHFSRFLIVEDFSRSL